MAAFRPAKRTKFDDDGKVDYKSDFIDYLNSAVSAFHCVAEIKTRLEANGFVELDERKAWDLQPGGKYFYTRNGTSLLGFAVGGAFNPTTSGFIVIGAHSDSPCPKLKPISILEKDKNVMLGVVGYGGGLWHTWFDRDLTVVGRALVKDDSGRVQPRLVKVKRALCRIPTLAIHLTSGEERSAFKPNLESHFPPMLATNVKEALWRSSTGADEKAAANGAADDEGGADATVNSRAHPLLVHVVAEELGCEPEDILDFELQLADTQPAALIGACEEFVSSGRLDNQASCYFATQALIESLSDGSLDKDSSIRMISMFDHEEVGSQSAQGAQSAMFEDGLSRISSSLGAELYSTKARSFQISSDMAHAVHPNYSERHDAKNKPRMHGGLVLKHNANQRYATNSIGATMVRRFAELGGAPVQEFCVKADSGCGSTIGPITASNTGIRTVDVGPPQLSMHSIRETMATDDIPHSINTFRAAFLNYDSLSRAVDVDGPDPFWSDPGVGWGTKTLSC